MSTPKEFIFAQYILSKKGMVRYPVVSEDTPRKSATLLGIDNSDLVLARYDAGRNEFQIFWTHPEQ